MGSDSSDCDERRFLFEYRHGGSEWALELHARDLEDARARLRTLPFASYQGEIVASGAYPVAGLGTENRPATCQGYHGSANDN